MRQSVQYRDGEEIRVGGRRAEDARGRAVVMVFSGEYDITVKERLRADLARLAGFQEVIFDLSEVAFIDAGTIGELIHIHNVRSDAGFEPETVVAPNPHLVKIFNLLQLQSVFRMAGSLKDAVRGSNKLFALDYARSAAP